MKKIFQILSLVLALSSMTACRKSFDTLASDPNRATSVPANLILGNVLLEYSEGAFNSIQRWNQYYVCNYAYYGNQEYNWTGYSFNNYNVLNNIQKM